LCAVVAVVLETKNGGMPPSLVNSQNPFYNKTPEILSRQYLTVVTVCFNVFPLILLYAVFSNYFTYPVTERRSEFEYQTIQLALPEVKSGLE